MADAIVQASFIDLNDDDLKEAVGSLHEYLKRIDEARKADEEIATLKERAKELDSERYGEEFKATKRRLAAARRVAESRGIKFTLPKIGEQDE